MESWLPDYTQIEHKIKAIPAGHPIFEERLEDWRRYLGKYGHLPSVLLTESGWMVNGHHRLTVAREKQVRLTGLIVKIEGENWIATGNLCLVE